MSTTFVRYCSLWRQYRELTLYLAKSSHINLHLLLFGIKARYGQYWLFSIMNQVYLPRYGWLCPCNRVLHGLPRRLIRFLWCPNLSIDSERWDVGICLTPTLDDYRQLLHNLEIKARSDFFFFKCALSIFCATKAAHHVSGYDRDTEHRRPGSLGMPCHTCIALAQQWHPLYSSNVHV